MTDRFHFTALLQEGGETVQRLRIPWQEDEPAPDLIITGDLVTLVLRAVLPDNEYLYERAIVAYVSEPSWYLAQRKEPDDD